MVFVITFAIYFDLDKDPIPPLYESCLNIIPQSFMNSGDYDDPDDYPDLAERLEAYKRELTYQ